MENLNFNKAIRTLRSVHLSRKEKAAIRERLFSHMYAGRKPIPSPFFSIVQAIRFRPVLTMFLALLVVLSSGTAAAWSAESTLPGDFLYPMKTKVSEPLVRAIGFANSIPDKVNYEWSLVEKRLEEAERLAAERKLEKQAARIKEAILDQRILALKTAKKFLPQETTTLTAKSSVETTVVAKNVGKKNVAMKVPAQETNEVAVDSIVSATATAEISLQASLAEPKAEPRGETYMEAVKKIDRLFLKHQDIVAELGLKLELMNGHTSEERKEKEKMELLD